LCYFHKNKKFYKTPKKPKKNIFGGFFLGGFFWVGFLLPTLPVSLLLTACPLFHHNDNIATAAVLPAVLLLFLPMVLFFLLFLVSCQLLCARMHVDFQVKAAAVFSY
jgi:hypothetical protein